MDVTQDFNDRIFSNKLPDDLDVSWNNRLSKTAGLTITKQVHGVHVARVELAGKVVDTYGGGTFAVYEPYCLISHWLTEKLKSTLCHELCHVAAWVIDGVRKPPHGKTFKKWCVHIEK